MDLGWLQICAEGQTTPCIAPVQVAYLAALLVGVVLLIVVGRRSARFHDVGAHAHAGRYRDQHRGRLDRGRPADPDLPRLDRDRPRRRACRTMGRRADRHPLEPDLVDPADPGRCRARRRILRAGRRCHRPDGRVLGEPGVFQLRSDDVRVGGFLALAVGIVAAAAAFLVVQATVGIPDLGVKDPDQLLSNQTTFVLIAIGCVIVGGVVAWLAGRTVFDFKGPDPRIRSYMIGATAIAARASFRDPSGFCSRRTATSRASTACWTTARRTIPRCCEPDRSRAADPLGLIGALVHRSCRCGALAGRDAATTRACSRSGSVA
jgi:hypothetical protein